MATEVKLPELAEGVDKGDVVSIMVNEGDTLELDMPILEVESEKATLPVPSSIKGKILKILVSKGEKIKVGQPILLVDEGGNGAATPADDSSAVAAETTAPPAAKDAPKTKGKKAAKAAPAPTHEDDDNDTQHDGDTTEDRIERLEEPDASTAHSGKGTGATAQGYGASGPLPRRSPDDIIPAGPAVRRIARELGIDLGIVQGSGKNGRISVEDLDPYIKGYIAQRGGGGATGPAFAPIELPDFTKFGSVRREKAETLRRKIAEKMSQSWSTVPHVHQFADADITELLALQKRYKEKVKAAGGQLTLTVLALKAVVAALKEFPQFNATYDVAAQEIVYKEYYNIGVAVDTPNGLIVPVLRDVDKKPLMQLAIELQELAAKTRDRKTSLDDLRGGSFTISNLGGIGGTHFTPIVNTPEVAILGIGRAQKLPRFDEKGNVVARDICPICVGYDHRVVDGADGARFTMRLVEILENFEAAVLGL